MPFAPTSPETKEVTITTMEPRSIDRFRITELLIYLDPNDVTLARIEVSWAEGHGDAPNFVGVNARNEVFVGQSVMNAIGAQVVEPNSRYDEVKNAVWQMLADSGSVPAGTAS